MESSREAVWRRQNMKDRGNTTAGEFPGINKWYVIVHCKHVRDGRYIFISLRVECILTECKKVMSIEPECAFRLFLLKRMKSRKEELLKETEELRLQGKPPSWKLEREASGETIGEMSYWRQKRLGLLQAGTTGLQSCQASEGSVRDDRRVKSSGDLVLGSHPYFPRSYSLKSYRVLHAALKTNSLILRWKSFLKYA